MIGDLAALEEALKFLNPGVSTLNYPWRPAEGSGWVIDISGNTYETRKHLSELTRRFELGLIEASPPDEEVPF